LGSARSYASAERALSSVTPSGAHLPRKPNYNFEKQRKEQNRQAKKDAKREEKLRRKQQEELQQPPEPSPETQ